MTPPSWLVDVVTRVRGDAADAAAGDTPDAVPAEDATPAAPARTQAETPRKVSELLLSPDVGIVRDEDAVSNLIRLLWHVAAIVMFMVVVLYGLASTAGIDTRTLARHALDFVSAARFGPVGPIVVALGASGTTAGIIMRRRRRRR